MNNDTGWDFGLATEAEWMPWGEGGNATARVVAAADGYHQVLIRAHAGYTGTPHEHEHAEFSYILEGVVRHNGTRPRTSLLSFGIGPSTVAKTMAGHHLQPFRAARSGKRRWAVGNMGCHSCRVGSGHGR
jgi:hypothetical protein